MSKMKKLYLPLLVVILINTVAIAQIDSLAEENDIVPDTIVKISPEKKSYKRVSDFKIYGGLTASQILLPKSTYESAYAAGFIAGFSYKRGRFGYWEAGLNYNGSVVALDDVSNAEETMYIRQLELPLTVGLNLLAETRRVLGIRIFGGVVPGYITSIGDNPFDLSLGDFNQFQLGGRLGVGVDVFFLFVEGGYQYGFTDLLKNQGSNLSQLYVLLGFRF
ncbi:outer membrane beta-barrel protein [Maribellus mangrovi]|uniref:outer membrane beta-barrel protein n=1 Tax=Maribellus mangrovi TaxID=3133146 RepID=UPI0030ECCB4A